MNGRGGPRPLALLRLGGDQIGHGVIRADHPAGIQVIRALLHWLAGEDLLEPFAFGDRQMMQQVGARVCRAGQPERPEVVT